MDMDAVSECPNDLNRYLQATYDCIPGTAGWGQQVWY